VLNCVALTLSVPDRQTDRVTALYNTSLTGSVDQKSKLRTFVHIFAKY